MSLTKENIIKLSAISFIFLLISGACVIVAVPSIGLATNYGIKMPPIYSLQEAQRYFYFGGIRQIWQYDSRCAVEDSLLIYKPLNGKCVFNNLEFDTTLTFDDNGRSVSNRPNSMDKTVVILGDSYAMGWGVNDNETFASQLQLLTNRPVFNFGVSSYATEREIGRLLQWEHSNSVDTIIIQYCNNDLNENKSYPVDRDLGAKRFRSARDSYVQPNIPRSSLSIYESIASKDYTSFLPFGDSKKPADDRINPHVDGVVHVLDNYRSYLKGKRVIIFYANKYAKQQKKPWSQEIAKDGYTLEFIDLEFVRGHHFNIDDHLNVSGHAFAAQRLAEIIK